MYQSLLLPVVGSPVARCTSCNKTEHCSELVVVIKIIKLENEIMN